MAGLDTIALSLNLNAGRFRRGACMAAKPELILASCTFGTAICETWNPLTTFRISLLQKPNKLSTDKLADHPSLLPDDCPIRHALFRDHDAEVVPREHSRNACLGCIGFILIEEYLGFACVIEREPHVSLLGWHPLCTGRLQDSTGRCIMPSMHPLPSQGVDYRRLMERWTHYARKVCSKKPATQAEIDEYHKASAELDAVPCSIVLAAKGKHA